MRESLEGKAIWYIAQLVVSLEVGPSSVVVVHVNYVLVSARAAAEAFARATSLGKASNADYENHAGERVRVRFLGLRELVRVHDRLEDGAEVMFTEDVGVTKDAARAMVRRRNALSVFRPATFDPARPDYSCREIVKEARRLVSRKSKARPRPTIRARH